MAEYITTVNPATGLPIDRHRIFDDQKINKVLKTAVNTYKDWKNLPIPDRCEILKKIADELRKEKENLARIATFEMGKPIQQGRDEVEKCAVTLEYYAMEGERLLANEMIETDAVKSYVAFRPLGVVLAIMPWNFPYWQVFRAFAPTVMAGNVMLLKHASNVCGCAKAIENVIQSAGATVGLLQTLIIPSSKVESLIDSPIVAGVTLTGSTEAGRNVAQAAGRKLKKCVLELGGSDAYIVLGDADIEQAASICVKGRIVNSGQSCVAAKRFIVVKSIRKEFETAMTTKMTAVTFGNPEDTANNMGPMARHDLRNELHLQVEKSVAMGARLLCGGFIPEGAGAFYPPTVLTNVKKGMPAYDEELFGPVAAIIEAKDEAEAIRIANDSAFGLGGAVLSADKHNAERIACEELEAGNCFVNAPVHSDPRLPFGGIKNSGYGRELGAYGIREFVNIKTVYVN